MSPAMDDPPADIAPDRAISEIAQAIPAPCRQHLIIVGSLAAGWHYFGNQLGMQVRTKDADCLLAPETMAVERAAEVANTLLAHGWTPENDGREPGGTELPVIRLRPPAPADKWFIELLTWSDTARDYLPVDTTQGRWSIAAFPYLSLTEHRAAAAHGIRVAQPAMMALANALNHPQLTNTTMSKPIGGRTLLRCSKDLGRILAIAHLEMAKTGAIDHWLQLWADAITAQFPGQRSAIALRSGAGLEAMLASRRHLEEAHHSCVHGLLAHAGPIDVGALQLAGQRLLVHVIEPLRRELA